MHDPCIPALKYTTVLLFRHVLHYDVKAAKLLLGVDLIACARVALLQHDNELKPLLIGFLVLRHSSLQPFVTLPIGVVLGC
jgi:hypothetical protein